MIYFLHYFLIVLRIKKVYAEKKTMHKKWSFPLRIALINVTKSAENCEFGHIYWINPRRKTSFSVQWENHIFAALKVVLTISSNWNRRRGIFNLTCSSKKNRKRHSCNLNWFSNWYRKRGSFNMTCSRYETILIAFIAVTTCHLKVTMKNQLRLRV